MNKLFDKFTFFKTSFAVIMATISFFSVAIEGKEISHSEIRAIAKTNAEVIRITKKSNKKSSLGKYDSTVTFKPSNKKIKISNKDVRLRENDVKQSINAFGFEVFDASVYLQQDFDNDGFYSEFDIEMDVDVDTGTANVYAEIYYRNGSGDWEWLTTTDVFNIEGNLASDSYTVAIELIDGFPTDYYDLLIDVYEDGFSGVVATLEPFDDIDLELLPFEDSLNDSVGGQYELFLDDLSFALSGDFDFDGFYHKFDMAITLSNETVSRNLQAVLYARDSVSNWTLLTSTYSAWVNYGDGITFEISGDWGTGYATDYYDFLIEIVDVDTGEVVNDFGPEYLALFERPMESYNFDAVEDAPVVIIDEGYSSGSTDSTFILLLVLMALSTKRVRKVVQVRK